MTTFINKAADVNAILKILCKKKNKNKNTL